MKVLMIGLGSIGQRHLRNIKRLYGEEIEILAYRTRRLQQTFSDAMQIRDGVILEEEYGIKVFTNLSDALKEEPDIAFVTNITSKHMEVALACAKAGCNLFVEKPLSDTMDGIEELKQLIENKKLVVFMGFQNRYHPCIQEMKKVLKEGKIGAIQSVSSEFSERLVTMHTYEDYRDTYMSQAEMGGGPILNLQIHDLDILHYLFGTPLGVFSAVSKNSALEVDVEDGASSIYFFRNENNNLFPAYSHTDFLQFPPAHKFKIVGETGYAEIDMNKASFRLVLDGEVSQDLVWQNFQRNDMFVEELKDFFNSVKSRSLPSIDINQGIVSLKMALSAKQSSNEKKYITMEV